MTTQILETTATPRGGLLRIPALLLVCCSVLAQAQPALTTIQDILYRADGTRFTGAVDIAWKPFQAGNSSFIPQQTLHIDIVNGVLRAKLVPTTNASPGANYEATFSSQGKVLFTELWAVPPTSTALKVRDVRVSAGTTVGNPPVFGQLSQISDIAGLDNELQLRPMRGFAFGPGRAAVINSTGQLDAAQGNLSDCVRVDGSAAPCSTGGGTTGASDVPGFVDHEVPGGLVNSSNATFTLASVPSPAASLDLYRNGLLMRSGIDYNLSGSTITFTVQAVPQSGDALLASYRTAPAAPGPLTGGLTVASPQILCSGLGLTTNSTTISDLGTCVIPANLLKAGDRVEVKFAFSHAGSSSPVQVSVAWGSQDTLLRSLAAVESTLVGSVNVAVVATSSSAWFTESRGALEATAVTSGTSTVTAASPITVSLRGLLGIAFVSDNLTLRHYTVTRYPAVTP